MVVTVGDISDGLVSRLKQKADEVRMGNGMDEWVFLGPVIRQSQKERAIEYANTDVQKGAKLVREKFSHGQLDE